MNSIEAIIRQISNEELKAMILELKGLRETGILLGGKTLTLINQISSDFDVPKHDTRFIVQTAIPEEASRRWCELVG